MQCPHCYAGSSPGGKHISYEDIERAVFQAGECGVCQMAISGGEPLLHPQLAQMLALCYQKGIVANHTTNGMHLTDTLLPVLKRYCLYISSRRSNGKPGQREPQRDLEKQTRGSAPLKNSPKCLIKPRLPVMPSFKLMPGPMPQYGSGELPQ
ncbi:MAG: radical SAM protein [Desulfobacteraceae bacterium]|nr:radical SAM protein [Desulfobacteraceae bacterium]